MSILQLNNVSYTYEKSETPVLRGISADFEAGKMYAIIGKSGAGKTTLLSLLSGLDVCGQGTILYNGEDLKSINSDRYRALNIGVVFQSYNLLLNASAVENVVLSMNLSANVRKSVRENLGENARGNVSENARDNVSENARGNVSENARGNVSENAGGNISRNMCENMSSVKSVNKRAAAYKLLEKVGIDRETADRKILKLSGGEQQRTGIARALSHNPDILIADEPTGNLDDSTEDEIMKILTELVKNDKRCVIIVTHSHKVASYADEVLGLSGGRLLTINQRSLL